MDHQFDQLAKVLAEGVPRREALRRIGGSLAGALLASLGLGRAWGQQSSCLAYCSQFTGQKQQSCRAACEACGGDTKRLCASQTSDNIVCCGPETPSCCGGICTNLQSDPDNCGECGARCLIGRAACCSGACVDLLNDEQNCGGCNNVCGGECCVGRCCGSGEVCTGDEMCCAADRVCAGSGTCCAVGQVCCGGTTCCDPKDCKNGVCSPPRSRRCTSDADCRLFSDYCDGCNCRALSTRERDPRCRGTIVQCFADPCLNKRAVCDASTSTCIVVAAR